MCLSQPHSLLAPPPVRDADDAKTFTATLDAMARRPSWTLRGVFKQPAATSRPGLPRRFHSKINLNDYWGVLEKVVKVEVSWPRTAPDAVSKHHQKHGDDDVVEDTAMDVDNEVNENLANERAEQSKMDVDVVEVKMTPPSPVEVKMTSPSPVEVKMTPPSPVKVKMMPPSPVKIVQQGPVKRGVKGRRRSTPRPCGTPPSPCGTPASPCGTPPSPCATPAPAPCRRAPLGTLNGMGSRGHLKKNLSPLSTFADNLARRLARQH